MYAQSVKSNEGIFSGLEELALRDAKFSFGTEKTLQDPEKKHVDFAQVIRACAAVHIDVGSDRLA